MKALNIVLWDVDRLVPYELNAKVHDDKQVARIAKSIEDLGWDQPIVVDRNGSIIKGHGRRLAAIKLGLKQVPVLVRDDLTEEQVKAARLADNRVAIGDIDSELLQRDLAALTYDLEGIFDKKELEFLVADLGDMKVEAFVEDLDREVASQHAETTSKIEETDERDVRVDKALGFKTLKGRDERHVARFMAQIEAETGKAGAEAFITFIRNVMAPAPAAA